MIIHYLPVQVHLSTCVQNPLLYFQYSYQRIGICIEQLAALGVDYSVMKAKNIEVSFVTMIPTEQHSYSHR